MKILLTGSTGFVGRWIKDQLADTHDIIETGRTPRDEQRIIRCDLSNKAEVSQLAENVSPDVIIHAAGNKNIRNCEMDPSTAVQANTESTKNLISVFGKRLIYISSDYVFPGDKGHYSESDDTAPHTIYGKTKLASEQLGLEQSSLFQVLRLSALYAPDSPFVTTLHTALENGQSISCYTDTHFSPTYLGEFIDVLKATLVDHTLALRTVHACGARQSRYDFALAYANTHGFDPDLIIPEKVQSANRLVFPEDISLCNAATLKQYGIAPRTTLACLDEMRKRWKP